MFLTGLPDNILTFSRKKQELAMLSTFSSEIMSIQHFFSRIHLKTQLGFLYLMLHFSNVCKERNITTHSRDELNT